MDVMTSKMTAAERGEHFREAMVKTYGCLWGNACREPLLRPPFGGLQECDQVSQLLLG